MQVSDEIKVGIMVAIALTILGILIIAARGTYLFQKGYTLKVYFDYVSGLDVGAPVRLAGMQVGEVKDLKLVGEKIEVTLKLKSTAKVRTDSDVTINSLGIVGEKYVEITLGSPQAKILKQGSVIYGINPVNVEQMLARTEAVVFKSERIVAFMDKMLGGDKAWIEFDKIIKNTATFTATLNELLLENKKELNATIKDIHSISAYLKRLIEENRNDFSSAVEKLNQIATSLQQLSIQLNNTVFESNKGITNTFTRLTKILDSIQTMLQEIEKGKGTLGKLISDEEVARHLSNAAKNIEELTLDLKKHPWKLLIQDEKKR